MLELAELREVLLLASGFELRGELGHLFFESGLRGEGGGGTADVILIDGVNTGKNGKLGGPGDTDGFCKDHGVVKGTIGWELVEQVRADKKLRSLTDEGRAPAYIKAAGDLGLGIADRAQIQLKEITI